MSNNILFSQNYILIILKPDNIDNIGNTIRKVKTNNLLKLCYIKIKLEVVMKTKL